MNNITRTEKRGFLLLAIVFALSYFFAFTNMDFFEHGFIVEDGPVEYGTAVMLFCTSILSIVYLIKYHKNKSLTWKFGLVMFAILFFFAAGEEISWGQRIFDIQTGEYFMEHNRQKEMNLHNLEVGGKKLNKIIFSQLLTLVIVVYLLIVPVLYRKKKWAKNLLDKFAVPVVYWHHTIAFIVCTLLVLIIPHHRKWEVYELDFSLIFFLIFLNPFNKEIYSKS
ncbi:hypothetical protein SAMN05216480_101761 [Pustulibacterium marinum]|uniref:Uncharacterized protein n=1 Tax=Pustulibacterium marinum TaxID=1224947 RepID=A0A1I7F999_9FLAO|nr:hypothetical protein [Pustulibacterium marinum]SFU32762.1 hypothetical protein SAMN05216480_101761 [Pustulibacterium marinum]